MLCQPKISEKGRLHTATLHALRTRSVVHTWDTISRDTGLTKAWLSRFNRDALDSYDVNKIETLYTFLTGNSLNV